MNEPASAGTADPVRVSAENLPKIILSQRRRERKRGISPEEAGSAPGHASERDRGVSRTVSPRRRSVGA